MWPAWQRVTDEYVTRAVAGELDPKSMREQRTMAFFAEQLGIHLDEDTDPPAWLGGTQPVAANEIVSCGNGLLHVGTRKLYAHTPQYFGTVAVPFDYDPAAPVPEKWLNFLSELWPDDQDSADALQEFFGWVLSGRTDLPPFEQIAEAFRERVRELGNATAPEPAELEPLDYVRLVDEEHEHRRSRRKDGMG